MVHELKEQAVTLRKQGMTYAEISSALDGAVSVDQCKRWLKGVKKDDTPSDKLLQEVIALATRPQGATNYEITGIAFKYNKDEKVTQEQAKSLKKRAKKQDSNCLFIPAWIYPADPIESNKLMLELSHNLYERIQEYVNDYMEVYPGVSRFSVMNEMVKLSNEYIMPESLSMRLERNQNIAELLYDRMLGVDELDEISALTEPTGFRGAYEDSKLDDNGNKEMIFVDEETLDTIW